MIEKNLSEILKLNFDKKNITYKENDSNLIIHCPICLKKDNKIKYKFYIEKNIGIFHCFRCKTKGNIFKLIKILKKYFNIDLTLQLNLIELIESKSNNIQLLSKIIESIDENYIKYMIEKNKNIEFLKKNLNKKTDIKLLNKYKYYLNNRDISYNLINHLPLILGNKPNSKLYYRIGLSSFLKTNFECRTILPNKKFKYLQSEYANKNDFIFLLPLQYYKQINNLSSIFDKFNLNEYENIKLYINDLYIVEGLFDSIKLNIFLNKFVISMSGYSKINNIIVFFKILSCIFKEFKINNINIIFDNDVNDDIIIKSYDTFNIYKNYINTEKIKMFKMPENVKDIGEIKSPLELKELFNNYFN